MNKVTSHQRHSLLAYYLRFSECIFMVKESTRVNGNLPHRFGGFQLREEMKTYIANSAIKNDDIGGQNA